jgi:hypothetical protein
MSNTFKKFKNFSCIIFTDKSDETFIKSVIFAPTFGISERFLGRSRRSIDALRYSLVAPQLKYVSTFATKTRLSKINMSTCML